MMQSSTQELNMANPIKLCGRGLRYIRQYGPAQLYIKVKERSDRNKAEAGYDAWLHEQLPNEEEDAKQREIVFSYNPCISILVPTYETPELFLRQMIESVLNQSYGNLELCLADGSPGNNVKRIVAEYEAKDARVKYQKLTENKGISENTNEALKLASGVYVGLLDHDDILLPGALFEVVKALNEAGGADALYTDEDKVNMDLSRHFQPHFKPDYNLEYLRSNNYICHFFVVKRDIANAVGGFRGKFDGAQDHDFILRCTEQADQVLHISKILYSWRSHEASTATNPESKLYAYEAGKRAVKAHLSRMGQAAEVMDTPNYGFYRVKYPNMDHKILRNSFANLNGQTDVNVVYYDMARNNSVTISGEEDYVLFACVKNGTLGEGFWDEMFSLAARPDAGMVCGRLYDRRGRLLSDVQMKGVTDPFGKETCGLKKGFSGYFHRVMLQQEVEVPTGIFLVKRSLLEGMECASINEICERVRERGKKILYTPWAVVYETK